MWKKLHVVAFFCLSISGLAYGEEIKYEYFDNQFKFSLTGGSQSVTSELFKYIEFNLPADSHRQKNEHFTYKYEGESWKATGILRNPMESYRNTFSVEFLINPLEIKMNELCSLQRNGYECFSFGGPAASELYHYMMQWMKEENGENLTEGQTLSGNYVECSQKLRSERMSHQCILSLKSIPHYPSYGD